MKNTKLTKKRINIIILICFIVITTGASIVLALLGTQVYTNATADKSQQAAYDTFAYFTGQLRKCENFSQVRTASLGGKIPALVISSEDSKTSKETWYFEYEGSLKKAVVPSGNTVTAESGEDIMVLNSADFRVTKPGLLEISITTENGDDITFNISFANSGGTDNE